jgi:predicted GNAT family acetyltransferase
LLTGWSYDFHLEVHGTEPVGQDRDAAARRITNGDYRIWEEGGQPVSYCGQSRPTPNGMAINAVFTPKALRGRGYAAACVGALCAEILNSGKSFCTLFADIANPTANGIYQRLGFKPLGEFVELDFV